MYSSSYVVVFSLLHHPLPQERKLVEEERRVHRQQGGTAGMARGPHGRAWPGAWTPETQKNLRNC